MDPFVGSCLGLGYEPSILQALPYSVTFPLSPISLWDHTTTINCQLPPILQVWPIPIEKERWITAIHKSNQHLQTKVHLGSRHTIASLDIEYDPLKLLLWYCIFLNSLLGMYFQYWGWDYTRWSTIQVDIYIIIIIIIVIIIVIIIIIYYIIYFNTQIWWFIILLPINFLLWVVKIIYIISLSFRSKPNHDIVGYISYPLKIYLHPINSSEISHMVLHPLISSDTTITGYLSLYIYIFIPYRSLILQSIISYFHIPFLSCDLKLQATHCPAILWFVPVGEQNRRLDPTDGWGKPARPWGKPRGKWSTNGGLKKHLWQWKMGVFEICLWNTLLNELTLILENYTSHHISQWKTSKLHTTYHQLPVSGQYFAVAKNGDLNRTLQLFKKEVQHVHGSTFLGEVEAAFLCLYPIPSYGGLLPWFYPQNQDHPNCTTGFDSMIPWTNH